MTIYRIHTNLLRLVNNDKTKDVFVLMGKIVEAENPYNTLTENELKEVERYLKKK